MSARQRASGCDAAGGLHCRLSVYYANSAACQQMQHITNTLNFQLAGLEARTTVPQLHCSM